MSTPTTPPAQGPFILPLPSEPRLKFPPKTDEERAAALAILDGWEKETIPDDEPDWDPRMLFPRCFP